MGPQWAATLVRAIAPTGADAFATKADLAALEERMSLRLQTGLGEVRTEMSDLRGELRGEMADLRGELRGEMADLRGELRGEMTDLRGQLSDQRGEHRGERAELRTDFAGLRAEFSEMRAEIADRLRSQTWRLSGLLLFAVGFAVTMVRIA
jgi:uncharacterized coiled-coil DUF342 family protein